jgi:hypothetical protein
MKKQFLFFAACGMIAVAACNSGGGSNQPAGPTPAQVDSMNKAVAADATKQQAEKDSIMNAANADKAKAQAEADSLKGALNQKDKDSKMTAKHRTSNAKTDNTPPPPPPTTSQSKWGGNSNQQPATNTQQQQPSSQSKWGH